MLGLLIVNLARAEDVRPTGKPQQLIKDQSFTVQASWQIPTLPTGQKFIQCIYYETFRAVMQTKDGPKPFYEVFPWAKEAIIRIFWGELREPEVFKDLLEKKKSRVRRIPVPTAKRAR